jgi:hypothetical protein
MSIPRRFGALSGAKSPKNEIVAFSTAPEWFITAEMADRRALGHRLATIFDRLPGGVPKIAAKIANGRA